MAFVLPIVAILVFAVLGVSYKLSDRLNCDQQHVNLFMFLTASLAMLAMGLCTGRLVLSWPAVVLGLVMGVICLLSVSAFRKACTLGRISTSWTVLNLALVIPVLVSIVLWGEHPGLKHYIGLGLTILAIITLGIDIGRAGE